MANVVIDIATEFTGKKGFKEAETATEKLNKGVKNLARNLGLAFGTAAVIAYGKASVRAALESQAEQERLNNILRVTTGATQAQIDILNEQATALERIGVVTGGNIKMTQSQLATFDLQISTIKTLTPAILDYVTAEKGATASASDFKSMTNGLAQALNGNFASLTRTGFVLDEVTKNTIKSGTETERAAALVKVLNSTYKDFNANLRLTDSGQMQVLANTAREVQTNIGTGIIDALKILSGDTTVENLSNNMRSTSLYLQDVIVGVGTLGEKLKNIPVLGGLNVGMIPIVGSYIEILRAAGKERREVTVFNKNEHESKRQILTLDNKADKLTKAQLANQKKILTTTKQLAAEKKKQQVLDKAALVLAEGQKVFEEEGIQLAAAAQGKLTEEERTRLNLKKNILDLESAINQGNVTAAANLANSLVSNAQKLAVLRTDMDSLNYIQNPFDAWLLTIQKMAYELSSLAMVKPVTSAAAFFSPEQQATADRLSEATDKITRKIQGDLEDRMKALAEARARIENKISVDNIGSSVSPASYGMDGSFGGGTSVVVNVSGSVTTERDLVSAITQGLYAQQASGTPIQYGTAYL
jgi:hypothetical protein